LKNPNFDESLFSFYNEIKQRYGTTVPDDLVVDLLSGWGKDAVAQVQVYKDLVRKYADLPEWAVADLVQQYGILGDPTAMVDRYAGEVRSMVSSYQSYINSGLLTVEEIQKAIIKRPNDYINILNERVQRILPESEWNLIMY
jgi:hypothetical protein